MLSRNIDGYGKKKSHDELVGGRGWEGEGQAPVVAGPHRREIDEQILKA